MKRIAFIKQDGTVALVLNCGTELFDVLTAGNQLVDATESDPQLTQGWAYDGENFNAPTTEG